MVSSNGIIVVGVDEAGRGPLAGPVVAGAFCVLRKSGFRARGDFDSKKLTWQEREEMFQILTTHPQLEWGIGKVEAKQIDTINILQATRLAMKKAVQSLLRKLQKKFLHQQKKIFGDRELSRYLLVLVDGNITLDIPFPQRSVPKADATVFECMAASIIAKVTRDRLMVRLHKRYPQYGFDLHKGYGTTRHVKALRTYGPCQVHRQSFKPVALSGKEVVS